MQPVSVNPLSVSIQPCGKKRFILDLRHVNRSLIKQRIKYENCSGLFCQGLVHLFLLISKVATIILKFRRTTKRFWGFAGVLQIPITKYFTLSPFFPLVCLQLAIYSQSLLSL